MNMFILLLALVAGSQAGSLERTQEYSEFESVCEDAQTVSGFTMFRRRGDLRFMLMCKEVDVSGKLELGECRDGDEFEAFNGAGEIVQENKMGSEFNCHPGEYLAGVKSTYEADSAAPENSVRKMVYKCCQFGNAKVEEEIGCHHVNVPSPFTSKKPFAVVKNKIVAASSCMRDVLSQLEITEDGYTLKYCPVTVEGAEYDESCVEVIKKEVIEEYSETFTETQTTTGEEMTVVQSQSEIDRGDEPIETSTDGAEGETAGPEGEEGEACVCVCGQTCDGGGGDTTGGTEGTAGTEATTVAGTDGTGDTDAGTQGTDAGTEATTAAGTDGTTEGGDTEGTTEGGDTEGTTEGGETTACAECEEAATEESSGSGSGSGSGSSEDESKRRAKRQTRTRTVKKTKITKTRTVTKTKTVKKTTRSSSSVTYSVSEEERNGMTVFVLAPSEKNELKRCPEEQCNCPNTCPGAEPACEEEKDVEEKEEEEEEDNGSGSKSKKSGSGDCKTYGKGQCKKEGKCEAKCGDREWDCDTGKCRCC